MTIHVVRLDRWIHPIFDETLQARSDIKLTVLKTQSSLEDNRETLDQADVYHAGASRGEIPAHWHVNQETLKAWPRLKLVSSAGAGYDTVDAADCTARDVLVVNQAGGNAVSVAEHAIGMMIAVLHRFSESDHYLRKNPRKDISRDTLMGTELRGKTLGLVGIGHIGREVARMASVFGLTVQAYDPYVDPKEIQRRGAQPVSDLNTLLETSDVVSLHCPRNEETMKMMDAAAFARMKKGAAFISTARGGIHDEKALYDALAQGHLMGAGLDVWHPEPPATDNPLLQLDTVIGTFHTAGVTREARRIVALMGAEQILDLIDGRTPPRMINPQVLSTVAQGFAALK